MFLTLDIILTKALGKIASSGTRLWYKMTSFLTDSSGNRFIDNAGKLGSANDGAMQTGRGVYLGAGQSVNIPITAATKSIMLYDIAAKEGKIITSFTDPSYHTVDYSFENLVVLDSIATPTDLTYYEANPEAMVQMYYGDDSHGTETPSTPTPPANTLWLDDYDYVAHGGSDPTVDATDALAWAIAQCNNSTTLETIGMRANLPITSLPSGSIHYVTKDITFWGESAGNMFSMSNSCAIQVPETLSTTLAVNSSRGDTVIYLDSVTGIEVGMLFRISSDAAVETGWNYHGFDISPITAVDSINKTITLSEAPNFGYLITDNPVVRIYANIELTLYQFGSSSSGNHVDWSMNFRGFSKVTGTYLTTQSDAIREFGRHIKFDVCYDLDLSEINISGGEYPILISSCRKMKVYNVTSANSRHPVDLNLFSADAELYNWTGQNNTSTIQCHPSFNVYFHDMIATDDTQLPTVRSTGVRIENCSGNSVLVGPLSEQWEVALVDASIRSEYTNIFRNFTYHAPNGAIYLSHSNEMTSATYDNVEVEKIRFGDGASDSTAIITNSSIAQLNCRCKATVSNTTIKKDTAKWQCDFDHALELSGWRGLTMDSTCVIEGYDYVVDAEYNGVSTDYTGVLFKDIAIDFRKDGNIPSALRLTWTDCTFDNVNDFVPYNASSQAQVFTVTNATYLNGTPTLRP